MITFALACASTACLGLIVVALFAWSGPRV